MSAAKAKGTRWESAVVDYLRGHGFRWADRIPLSGSKDRCDVTVGPGGPVVEAKNLKQDEWAKGLDEANKGAANAHAPFGVLWAHRRGKGSPGEGFVVMDGATFTDLLRLAGWGDEA